MSRALIFIQDDRRCSAEKEKTMTIMPQGEDLRKAVKWISEMRQMVPSQDHQKLVEQACLKFNLSPVEAEYLARLEKDEGSG